MEEMMENFQAPGVYPCPISELRVLPRHRGGPGTTRAQLQSWWGANVFRYIRERMQSQRLRKGHMNWEMDRAIKTNNLWLAGVGWSGMVWPTIVFPLGPSYGEQAYGSYCQGLALEDGARAWVAHPEDLEIYGPYQSIVQVPPEPNEIPSTVRIVELTSDDGDEADYVFVD